MKNELKFEGVFPANPTPFRDGNVLENGYGKFLKTIFLTALMDFGLLEVPAKVLY